MKKQYISRAVLCAVSLLCLLCLAASAAGTDTQVQPAACVVDIQEIVDVVKSTYIPDYTYFVAHSPQKWVGQDNVDGTITEPCSNKEVQNTHGRYGNAWQSNGFARFVFYHVFGSVPTYDYHSNAASLSSNVKVVGRYATSCGEIRGKVDGSPTEQNLKKLFAQARIGDIIVLAPKSTCFLKGTSMVFLEAGNAGVKVYQADYTGACAVSEITLPYSTLAEYHCVSLLRAKNYPTEQYLEPVKVAQVSTSAQAYAHNENVDITWLPAKYATSYQLDLVNSRGEVVCSRTDLTGQMLSLTGVQPGTYTAKVVAINDKGRSEEAESNKFVVHPKLTVTFVDYNDAVITTQEVAYGGDVTAPPVPVRKGHKFAGWSEGMKNITADMRIQALYELEKYTVTFYSVGKKEMLGAPQQVYYGEAAVLPEDVASFGLNDGYVFSGWHIEFGSDGTDYNCVDGNMTVIATQTWGEGKLPITVNLNSAVLREDGKTYDITGSVKNNATEAVSFKLLATMKTAAGKAVKCAILDEYTLAAGASASIIDTIVYSEKITSIEYVAVGVRENDKTGGAYSLLTSVGITAKKTWGNWSEWKTQAESGHDAMETKTQYRYRNKVWGQSSSQNLGSPWVYDRSTYTWSAYGGWSSWSSGRITASDAVYVENRTAYLWFYYDCPYCGGHSYYNQHYTWAGGCGRWISDSYYRTTWGPSYSTKKDFHGTGRSYTDNSDAGRAYCWSSGAYGSSQTQYRAKTRYKIYTYHYWRWGDWSNWSDTYISGGETGSRVLYRYRDEVELSDPSAGVEDTSGKTFDMKGVVQLAEGMPDLLDGRRATVMVYKKTNSDPTEAQLEYVGQIKIGEGNSYDFSFKPKEDPTEETGDFIVALGVEGCDKLVNIATIHPEGITHTVSFYVDGELYHQQTVKRGEGAIVPTVPEKEGYIFVKWNESTTAVEADIETHAVFQPVAHTITFIDWEKNTLTQNTVLHNETIPYPKLESMEGVVSRKWDKEETVPVATENMVVETVTEYKTFTVVFKDSSTTYSTQTVAYGKAAKLPSVVPVEQGKVFEDWVGNCSYNAITKDVVFTPKFVYEQTVAAPQAEIKDKGDGTNTVSLSCDTEGATIYYVIEEHDDSPVMLEDEQEQAIKEIRLDLLQAELVGSGGFLPGASETVGPGSTFDQVFGATGPMENGYNFVDEASVYTGEEIVLKENQSIIFLASAAGMNTSMPQIENAQETEIYYTGTITENTLRQYKQSVEGELCLVVDSDKPVYKEGQFTLCLYDEQGVLVDLIALTAVVAPGSNVIRFENIAIQTDVVCATGKLLGWMSNGDVTPILDVKPFVIK